MITPARALGHSDPLATALAALGAGLVLSLLMVVLALASRRRRGGATSRERAPLVAALHESELRFRSLVQSARDAIVLADNAGHIVAWNPAAAAMFGYREEEVLGRPLTVLMPERHRAAHQRGLDRLRATGESRVLGKTLELEGLRRDGVEFPLELSLATWTADGRAYYSGILRDITDRRQVQAELERSRRELAEAERLAHLGSWSWDMVADRIHWSDELYRIFGVTPGGFAASYAAYLALIHPDDRARVDGIVRTAARDHAPFAFDHRLVRPDGTVRIIHGRGAVVTDESGRAVGMFGSAQDVTELRQAEEELERRVAERTTELRQANERLTQQIAERVRAQEALRRSQEELIQTRKLEAVGKLAGGIAHEFNNLLTVIIGYGELVVKAARGQRPLTDHILRMIQAAERGASLTQQLLAFGRKQMLRARVLDLNELVTALHQMLGGLIGEEIEVTLRLRATCAIRADPSQLQQALLNLVNNACDAMPEGGRLTIATADLELAQAGARPHAGVPPGSYVTLSVRDTGTGMTAETQARIFEPFFTTKEVGKGTGLGLSTVYGIVAQSDGHIRVESAVGEGTVFTLYFPAVDAAAVEGPEPDAPPELPGGTETILVVEDEPELRTLVREMLEPLGYQVLEAKNGEEAVRLCERRAGPVHLLVTDVVMPGMTGRQLADRLRDAHPRLQVLYMSGYTQDRLGERGVSASEAAFLPKPFSTAALARRVRERLDAARAGTD